MVGEGWVWEGGDCEVDGGGVTEWGGGGGVADFVGEGVWSAVVGGGGVGDCSVAVVDESTV